MPRSFKKRSLASGEMSIFEPSVTKLTDFMDSPQLKETVKQQNHAKHFYWHHWHGVCRRECGHI
jgi:hypothetical protein